jgi:hypothetical protein
MGAAAEALSKALKPKQQIKHPIPLHKIRRNATGRFSRISLPPEASPAYNLSVSRFTKSYKTAFGQPLSGGVHVHNRQDAGTLPDYQPARQGNEDIFGIQEEISLTIADQLKLKMLTGEKEKILKRHTEDHEAYELYLKGLHFWRRH